MEQDSWPAGFVDLGGATFFAATDPLHGRELWTTDGSEEGTRRVADVCPGSCSALGQTVSSPLLGTVGGALLFVAQQGDGIAELWTSDGTAPGTRRVRRFRGVGADLDVRPLYAAPSRLVLSVRKPTDSLGTLWVSDGTAPGTVELAEVTPGVAAVLGETLYFTGRVPLRGGPDLWRSDGTPEGTRSVLELCEAPACSFPEELATAGGHLYFKRFTTRDGLELWRTDGTAVGTELLDLCPGRCAAAPLGLTPAGDRLYFSADDGTHGRELWRTDGLSGEAVMLADATQVRFGGDANPRIQALVGGRAYFAVNADPGGLPVWVTDGTPGGTRPAPELFPYGAGAPVTAMAPLGETLVVTIDAASAGGRYEIWALGPGSAQLRLLARDLPNPELGPAAAGRLFFVDADPRATGGVRFDLWSTDGTAGGTRRLVSDLSLGTRLALALGAARVIFSADDRVHGFEPWTSDGTVAGTRLLRNLAGASGSSSPRDLAALGDSVLFSAVGDADEWGIWWRPGGGEPVRLRPVPNPFAMATAAANGRLFVADGKALAVLDEEAGRLTDLAEVAAVEPTAADGGLFFAHQASRQELWATDGTAGGTRLIADLGRQLHCFREHCPYYPRRLVAAGHTTYFLAYDDSSYRAEELWVSDGTAGGTHRVAALGGEFGEAVALDIRLVFAFSPSAGGDELWASDGTAEGTFRLRELPAGGARLLTVGDGAVHFVVAGSGGDELWRTDGTPGGTGLVSRLGGGAEVRELAAGAATQVLAVFTEETGEELWVSHGGEARLLADLRPGAAGSHPTGLRIVADRLVFAADDGVAGHELWVSDGTVPGTLRVADLAPGPLPSSPGGFTRAGGRLLFAADDAAHGRELFELDLGALPRPCAPGVLCLHDGRFVAEVVWRDRRGRSRRASPVPAQTPEAGIFWFSREENWELMMKVLDGCAVNGHFWVFAGAATNLGYTLSVTDRRSGHDWMASSPAGRASPAIADTRAFPCRPGSAPPGSTAPRTTDRAAPGRAGSPTAQLPPPPTLYLHGGQFQVHASWRDFRGHGGSGHPAELQTDESGLFWFFRPENWELMVKILDGCALNGHYWVLAAGITNLGFDLSVTGPGGVWSYVNPLGRRAPAVLATRALPCD